MSTWAVATALSVGMAVLGLPPSPATAATGDPGSLDSAFNNAVTGALATATSGTGLNGSVTMLTWDGSGYLVGGNFSNGPGSGGGDNPLFRVTAGGALDDDFNNALTDALAVATGGAEIQGLPQSTWDGSGYLVSAWWNDSSGDGQAHVFRVNADGSFDTDFNEALSDALAAVTGGVGLNSPVNAVAWDGSGYLVGGSFPNGPGTGVGFKRVFRVNSDGTLDAAFNNALSEALESATGGAGLNYDVFSTAWDGTGYLVSGAFTNGPGTGAGDQRAFRVNADGSLDDAFNNALSGALAMETNNAGLDSYVWSTAWDGSGYLIGGYFTNGPGAGAGARRVFRVNADGSLDSAFNNALSGALAMETNNAGLNGYVWATVWDGSGYLVGGYFDNGPGTGDFRRVFRVTADGSLDATVNDTLSAALAAATGGVGLDSVVNSLSWDGSGYLVGGDFSNGPGSGAGAKKLFRALGPGHTVTFDANGGTGSMSAQTASAPIALTANAFTRVGYTFAGWNTAAGGGGTAYADQAVYPFAAHATLYAQWSPLPSRTVTFDANGGTGSMPAQAANVPTALSANAFTRAGFSFAGWNTAAGGGGTAYADQAVYPFAADATLYAQWTALPTPTPPTPPAPPSLPAKVMSVSAKAKPGKVIVRWAALATPVTGYLVHYSTNKKTWKPAGTAAATATSLVWRKGKKGTAYSLRVAATSVAGNGPWSKPVKITAR